MKDKKRNTINFILLFMLSAIVGIAKFQLTPLAIETGRTDPGMLIGASIGSMIVLPLISLGISAIFTIILNIFRKIFKKSKKPYSFVVVWTVFALHSLAMLFGAPH